MDLKSNIWFPFTQMKTAENPLEIVSAKGTQLTAKDGKTYIDANSSWWVNVHGHGHPHIQEAIHKQFGQLDHVLLAGVKHPKAEEVASRVCGLLPDHFNRVFFSDDGSTAVEVALKMVFQFWHNQGEPRRRVLALDGAYHGDTFGAMSIGQRGYFNEPFEHFFFDVDFLEFPTENNHPALLKQAKELFETNEFAGLIVEPLVQGSAGMRMYSPEFLNDLVELAKQFGVKVIFDEIMTGWGRTGKMFSMDHIELNPDIVCLSKGLTGGVLPMGLTVAGDDIFNAFLDEEKTKALLHGHSYTGNPLACAAACASMDLFAQAETTERINRLTERNAGFKELVQAKFEHCSVRQTGTILAIEIHQEEATSYFASIRDEAYAYFLSKGILLRPLGNVIFINPPYCITDEELQHLYDSIEAFLEKNQ